MVIFHSYVKLPEGTFSYISPGSGRIRTPRASRALKAPRPGADGAHRRAADFAARGPPLFLGRQQGSKRKENGKKPWENQDLIWVFV
jgi:hypothetical protein